jgi:hypothetical protein
MNETGAVDHHPRLDVDIPSVGTKKKTVLQVRKGIPKPFLFHPGSSLLEVQC